MGYDILFAVIGLGSGLLISAGVFALITSSGLMARMAQTSHTANYVQLYENIVIIGAVLCNIFWIFNVELNLRNGAATTLTAVTGLTQGMYVGCLAVSLAEALDATAIFARRSKIKMGFGIIILFAALGKAVGSMFQFFIL